MIFTQCLPDLGLSGLHPCQQVCWVQGAGRVIATGIALAAWRGVEPAMRCQVITNVFFKGNFVVQRHAGVPLVFIVITSVLGGLGLFQRRLQL